MFATYSLGPDGWGFKDIYVLLVGIFIIMTIAFFNSRILKKVGSHKTTSDSA
jgi:hypothetical protein